MATYLPEGALKTQIDHELGAQEVGLETYQARQAAKAAANPGPKAGPTPGAIPWRIFCQRHPEYDSDLWAECRALYAGGPKLLRDKAIMERVFPEHRHEDAEVYKERVKRAHYFPYAGSIIDQLVAGLAADPVSIQPEAEENQEDADKLPEWWRDFLGDVSAKGGKRQSCQVLLLETIREALITGRGWLLVDLPQTPEEYVEDAPDSLLAQERAGLLDPYAIGIPAEYVIDWQMDTNGELEWALLCDSEERREGLAGTRDSITKTFTWYDRLGWERYQITFKKDKPPQPDDGVPFLDRGVHPFGKVPLACLELPEGLWAMGKLESLAKEHLNKRNAVAWAEYKALYAILYEFLAPEEGSATTPTSEAQENPDRAIDQTRGQGFSQVRGHQDAAAFIGPDVAPFKEGRESCAQIMQEMHRVMFVMAQGADVGGAALRRSGESKAQDKAVSMVILRALGAYLRDLMRDVVMLVGAARKELALEPRVDGAEQFDSTDVMGAVEEAVAMLNGVPMKSPTFMKAYLMRTYKAVMGDELTEDDIARIRQELEEQISAEEMAYDLSTMLPPLPDGDDDTGGEGEDEDDDEDRQAARDAATGGEAVKSGPKPAKGRVYSSSGKG
jgi:hypothetical protein